VEVPLNQSAALCKLKAIKQLKKSEVVQLALDKLFSSLSPDEIEELIKERRG